MRGKGGNCLRKNIFGQNCSSGAFGGNIFFVHYTKGLAQKPAFPSSTPPPPAEQFSGRLVPPQDAQASRAPLHHFSKDPPTPRNSIPIYPVVAWRSDNLCKVH